MSSRLFEEARRILAASPEQYFPDGERRSDGWWWKRRPEERTPSCPLVPGTDQVKDFGDPEFRASILDCYAERQGLSPLEAAKQVAPGAVEERERPARNREKVRPVTPVPEEALAQLNAYIRSDYAIQHYR